MAWKPIHDPSKTAEPSKRIPGVYIRGSKSGNSIQIVVDDLDVFLIELRKRLTMTPHWKKECGKNARVFYISAKGQIAELWPDEEQKPRRPRTNPAKGEYF